MSEISLEISIPSPSPIKPEYLDLLDDEFVSMDPIWKYLGYLEYIGKYEANKLGQIRNSKSKKMKKYSTKGRKYPMINLGSPKTGDFKSELVHKLLAILFLVNDDPKNKTQIDHIDRKKSNFSLNNLRWVTPEENNKNRKELSRERLHFRIYTEDLVFIEEKPYSNWTSNEVKNILTGMKSCGKYKGKIYKTIDTEVERYKEKYGDPAPMGKIWDPEKPEENGWAETIYTRRYIDRKGFILLKNGKLTVGFLEDPEDENSKRAIVIDGHYEYIHRLLASAFNGKVKLNRKDVVDHKDTDITNLNASNLSICWEKDGGQKLNMNNPLTLEKLSIPVSQIVPETGEIVKSYSSKKSAAESLGLKDPTGSIIIRDGNFNLAKGYLFSEVGKEKERWKDYISYIETSKNFPKWWWTKDRCKKEAEKYKTRTEFYKGCLSAYKVCSSNGWLRDFFPITHKGWTNKEICEAESRKYKNRKSFEKGSPGAYAIARKRRWIDEFFPPKEKKLWTKEECILEAKKYKNRSEFRCKAKTAYRHSKKNNWIDDVFPKRKKENHK